MIISIDYDEYEPESYRGVRVFRQGFADRWFEGNGPAADFRAAVEWASRQAEPALFSSSVDHFIKDGGILGDRPELPGARAVGYVRAAATESGMISVDQRGPSPAALREWRDAEQLSQEEAASVAGVKRVAWARWESSDSRTPDAPGWLQDVLMMRWGSCPGT